MRRVAARGAKELASRCRAGGHCTLIAAYARAAGLGAAFVFDTSMDTFDTASNTWTYELTGGFADALGVPRAA